MLSIYNLDEKNGIIAPQIKKEDGSVVPPAWKIPTITTTLFEAYGLYVFLPNTFFGYRNSSIINNDLRVDWVTGACFMVKKEFFESLGLTGQTFKVFLKVWARFALRKIRFVS